MAQSIINSALNDPAASLNAATDSAAQTAAQPTSITPTAATTAQPVPQPAASTTPSSGIINGAAAVVGATSAVPSPAVKPSTNYSGILSGLYQSELGRAPDAPGLAYWQNQMSNGITPDQIKSAMDQSAEYAAGHMAHPTNGIPLTGAASVTPSGYTPATVPTPTQWSVTTPQTVAGQVTSLMDPNSPLIQQAMTQGKEYANERGLLNSSIGETSALNSAYQAALPIAQSDASTYSKAAGYNADQQNQANLFNANAQNAAAQASLSAQTQSSIAHLQAQTQTNLAYLDSQTKTNLASMSNDNQIQLATIEAQYHNQMQSSASAQNLFSQITQNITNISSSKDMDAAAKQTAVDNQLSLLKSGMQINGAIGNLNLGGLLDFSSASQSPASTSLIPAGLGSPLIGA